MSEPPATRPAHLARRRPAAERRSARSARPQRLFKAAFPVSDEEWDDPVEDSPRRLLTALAGFALLAVLGGFWLLNLRPEPAQRLVQTPAPAPAAAPVQAAAASLLPAPPAPPAYPPAAMVASMRSITPTTRLPAGFLYLVQPGDTIPSLAQRFSVFEEAIAPSKPGTTDAAGLPPGTSVTVPSGADALEFLRSGWLTMPEDGAPPPPMLAWPLMGEVEALVQSPNATGIDIFVNEGTAVRAAAAGVVASAMWDECCSYGRHVIIDHGNGYGTIYAHLSWYQVSPGDRVAAGQMIGASGRTSGTIGPRLHFGLLRGLAFDLNVVPLERP